LTAGQLRQTVAELAGTTRLMCGNIESPTAVNAVHVLTVLGGMVKLAAAGHEIKKC